MKRRDYLIIWTATAIAVVATIFAFCNLAHAEWGLYVNRDNKRWVLEQTFAFEWETDRNCKSAARAVWADGKGGVIGVACVEYSATGYASRGPARTMPGQPGQTPGRSVQDTGRGRADANVEYRQRVLESAIEAGRTGGHQRVYTNGDSYSGREIKDAERALGEAQKARDAR